MKLIAKTEPYQSSLKCLSVTAGQTKCYLKPSGCAVLRLIKEAPFVLMNVGEFPFKKLTNHNVKNARYLILKRWRDLTNPHKV